MPTLWMLSQRDQTYPDAYFWFDLVCSNQHGIEARPFEWFCTTFKESIQDICSVLLVMTPWDDPIPLQRVRCLFKMYSTIGVQADMHIAFPSSHREAFKAAIGGTSTPLRMFLSSWMDGPRHRRRRRNANTSRWWRCWTVVSSLQR